MIPQQTVSVRIGCWLNVPGIELEEIVIVVILNKDILTIVAAIVDMIVLTELQGFVGHC